MQEFNEERIKNIYTKLLRPGLLTHDKWLN